MENFDDISFFRRMAQLRREAHYSISPESFNDWARELYGMNVKAAQKLYTKYMAIMNGKVSWEGEKEEENIDVLKKGKAVFDRAMKLCPERCPKTIDSYLGRDRSSIRNGIGVWFRVGDEEMQLLELNITHPGDLAKIYDLYRRDEAEIICIVPCVDSLSLSDCSGNLDSESGKELRVYDGDIFVVVNQEDGDFWDRSSENGVYVCLDGAYRRLLYTVGKGYVTPRGEVNVANDANKDDAYGEVFTFDERKFNHYIVTLDHSWRRIGNIHVDVTVLMEEPRR